MNLWIRIRPGFRGQLTGDDHNDGNLSKIPRKFHSHKLLFFVSIFQVSKGNELTGLLDGQGIQNIMQSAVVLELVGSRLQGLVIFSGILLTNC